MRSKKKREMLDMRTGRHILCSIDRAFVWHLTCHTWV